jgi:hypothetical protein
MNRKNKPDIQKLRARKAHRIPSLRIKTIDSAAKFINNVGFCLLFPIDRINIPSLYDAACGGQRKIMAGWSETMQKLWNWKDELAANRQAFFGKYFKGRPSFISLDMLPYFYAISGNYGEIEDYQEIFEEGKITQDAKRICDVLYKKGAMPTVRLKKEVGFRGKGGGYRFEKTIKELQRSLIAANRGVYEGETSWPSIIVDLLPRIFPKEVKKSLKVPEEKARNEIMKKFFDVALTAKEKDLIGILGWKGEDVQITLDALLKDGVIHESKDNFYLSKNK